MRGVFKRGRALVVLCLLVSVMTAAAPVPAGAAQLQDTVAGSDPGAGEPSFLDLLADWFTNFSRLSVPGG